MAKSELKRQPKGAFELEITVPKEAVGKEYNAVVEAVVSETELPGFRKGKAPREKVEATLDKSKILEKVLQRLVPQAYVEAINEHRLKPILNPRVHMKSVKEGEDWVFSATASEAPEVKLGNYRDEVKKSAAGESLWVPGKDDPNKKSEPDKDQKLNKILDHLIQVTAIEPSDLLIEEEANHALARLVDQTNTLGVTVEQYLSSTGKTPEGLRAEYAQSAKRNLQVEFLLNALAEAENLSVNQQEIDQMIQAIPNEADRQNVGNEQRGVIKAILIRRKALDRLLALA
jgi:FKBP-type peptidyl-prolyl cis-trans isomerase (trigger factor)